MRAWAASKGAPISCHKRSARRASPTAARAFPSARATVLPAEYALASSASLPYVWPMAASSSVAPRAFAT
jgi:hypothetical protein